MTDLRFSPTSSKDVGSFRLLELPPDLCKLVESAEPLSLTIKGQADEDAVLCTSNKTYAVRSIVLSNSVLVVTRPPSDVVVDGDAIVIRDQVKEILELIPSVPRLYKLVTLLKGMEYDEGQEDMDEQMDVGVDGGDRPTKRRKLTYEDAQREIQASEVELASAIKDKYILILNGHLRPIAPKYLSTILELLLNSLISLGLPHTAAPMDELIDTLADEHEIARQVSRQVMGWFGEVSNGKWKMDVGSVVKEVGLGILRNHKDDPILEDEFLSQWTKAVGDTFESTVSLSLLSGNYFSTPTFTPIPSLTYFPSSTLPLDPAARFADLFATRPKWLAPEIAPFLTECAVDAKERDKLLLKFARATTEGRDVFYTARAKYNG